MQDGLKINKLEKFTFYNDEIVLEYDPIKHIYLFNGDVVPSVTEVVKIIDKSNILINWAVKITIEKLLASVSFPITEEELTEKALEAKKAHRERLEDAGAVGTRAHNWIEGFIKGDLDVGDIPDDPRVINCCDSSVKWMNAHDVKWVCTERKIYSREHKYAGTLDGIAYVSSCQDKKCCPDEFKNRLSLIDWKTSNALYPEYVLQVSAYGKAYEEETKTSLEDRWIIRLGKTEGDFEIWHLGMETYDSDFMTFRNALDLSKSMKALNNRIAGERNNRAKKRKN